MSAATVLKTGSMNVVIVLMIVSMTAATASMTGTIAHLTEPTQRVTIVRQIDSTGAVIAPTETSIVVAIASIETSIVGAIRSIGAWTDPASVLIAVSIGPVIVPRVAVTDQPDCVQSGLAAHAKTGRPSPFCPVFAFVQGADNSDVYCLLILWQQLAGCHFVSSSQSLAC